MYDAVMIGSGPAGLSAALYTSRADLKTLVIGKDRGALEKADRIENYFGMAEPISGCELVENTKTQARSLGVEFAEDEIFHISWNGHFILEGKNGIYEALAVLLATGTGRKTLKIKGLKELEGRGVSYCAICDAFFYRNKEVAVLGNEAYAVHEMSQLLPVVKSVTLLTNGQELKAEVPEDVRIIQEPIVSIDGAKRVEGVTFADGNHLSAEGIFVALGSAGAMELARKAGAFTEGQNIKVNEKMETNVPGLFAAGDCIGGLLQISAAVGEGAQAAMSMIPFVRKQRKEA